ncbi:MAG: hypothetical protein DWI57_13740 [Chloroflexi bacterium]|nr:MAG: hypothetical protein DWI57_13740 [Chloroflexota bacterium]
MGTTITISDEIARSLDRLPGNGFISTEDKLRSLLVSECKRRLARYLLTDTRLSQKYAMDFNTFEKMGLTAEPGHTWEVDQDSMTWETAIDGIASMERQIDELQSGLG